VRPVWPLCGLLCLALAGCGKRHCPDDMQADSRRSKKGQVVFCVSKTDKSQAAWIELHDPKQRKQLCPFLGGRPGGLYQAWHSNGARRLEGRYQGGLKVGVWTQWAPDGRKMGDGEYRDGKLIQGVPVGTPASCEEVVW
jgi:hypothetical protein